MHPKLKKFLVNSGLILAGFVVALACLEIGLRFTSYGHLLQRDRHIRHYYRADAAKGFDIRPNVGRIRTSVDNHSVEYDIWSNELGCFDAPYRGEDDFILLLGDSFAHGYAPFEDKWGTRLEKLLDYRVLKCGVNGYGTRQELLKAEEIIARIKKSPRLIIVGYFWNDLNDDDAFPSLTVVDGFLVVSGRYKDPQTGRLLEITDLEKEYTLWDKLAGNYPLGFWEVANYHLDQHLITLNLVSAALARWFPPKFSYTNPLDFMAFSQESPRGEQAWVKHLENLRAIKHLAAAQGAELLVVLIPTNTQVYPFLTGGRQTDLERPNRILGDFLQQEGIRRLDLLPFFRQYADQTPRKFLSSAEDLYWRANSHWSIKGEHLAGLLVSRCILENNLLKVADRDEKLKAIEDKLKDFH
jgi:hypothetical protein